MTQNKTNMPMEYKCIFCGDKVKSNDASYTIQIHAEAMKKEQIVATIFEGDICGLCASYFNSRYIRIIKENLKI